MNDTFEQRDDEAFVTDPAPAPSVPQPGFAADDDFERSLAEYDAATKANEPEAEAEIEDPSDLDRSLSEYQLSILRSAGVSVNASDADLAKAFSGDSLHRAFRSTRDKLIEFARDLQRQVDFRDFYGALEDVRASCPAAEGLSDTMLAAFLHHTYDTSIGTQRDFENRYSSPLVWERRVTKLSEQLAQQVQPPIDQDATADRLAIAQWMTRGATKNAPARPGLPSNLSSMPNAEFVKALADMGVPNAGTLV